MILISHPTLDCGFPISDRIGGPKSAKSGQIVDLGLKKEMWSPIPQNVDKVPLQIRRFPPPPPP